MLNDKVLVAPRPFEEFTPEEYHSYVESMHGLRIKRKKASPAEGLSVSRTKKGSVSIRKSKTRAFNYVLRSEIEALAMANGFKVGEVWNAFVTKQYLIVESRLEAERINNERSDIPW